VQACNNRCKPIYHTDTLKTKINSKYSACFFFTEISPLLTFDALVKSRKKSFCNRRDAEGAKKKPLTSICCLCVLCAFAGNLCFLQGHQLLKDKNISLNKYNKY